MAQQRWVTKSANQALADRRHFVLNEEQLTPSGITYPFICSRDGGIRRRG
jgi:hypothetical protein